ncbi:MAG: sulfatase family protein, partial [Bryobacteraceae bacterium]
PVPPGVRTKPPWRPFKDPARIWLNADKLPYPRYYDDMLGTYIARQAAKFLEEHKDTPFALWVSFLEPHSPFDFPVEDRDLFDPARFIPPRVGPEDAWQIPLIFRDLTEQDKRGILAAYYTSVAYLDRNIGYCLGHHGRFEKHCSYEPAIRVPLIISWPGRIRRGVVRDLTEGVDVAPTVLDLLGIEPLPVQHGRSLRPYLEGGRPARRREYVVSEYLENEEACVRTDRFKLVFCSGRRERQDGYKTDNPTPGRWFRLYDLRDDPGEFDDVSRKHPEVVERLMALMLERFRQTHPEARLEPRGLAVPEALEYYLRPRDA